MSKSLPRQVKRSLILVQINYTMKKILLLICLIGSCFSLDGQAIKDSYIVDLKEGQSKTFVAQQRIFISSYNLKGVILQTMSILTCSGDWK